ncbi:cupin domain-containing protein [Ruania alba]|uniref:Cupin domain-containing protein n=1 Tax=Ruania alba TaxID=648782 RepID=A0A1H5EXK1_9MICO|nr:cupin domain-containing protein [Ruania alba]SED95688.1 Cupin domain-containing protein [Ruania alba]
MSDPSRETIVDKHSTVDEKSTHIAAVRIGDIPLKPGALPILDRAMRLRRMDVHPGGVIGLHDHSDRPAILFVLHGSMTVHDDNLGTSAVVNEGEAVAEFGDVQHWAQNNSDKLPLALLTFDLLDDSASPLPTTMPPGH